jgi:hypothetical protein
MKGVRAYSLSIPTGIVLGKVKYSQFVLFIIIWLVQVPSNKTFLLTSKFVPAIIFDKKYIFGFISLAKNHL